MQIAGAAGTDGWAPEPPLLALESIAGLFDAMYVAHFAFTIAIAL